MKPNAAEYDPRPQYFRELAGSTGKTQPELAKVLGVDERTIRRWRNGERKFPYVVQFSLECLVLSVD